MEATEIEAIIGKLLRLDSAKQIIRQLVEALPEYPSVSAWGPSAGEIKQAEARRAGVAWLKGEFDGRSQ